MNSLIIAYLHLLCPQCNFYLTEFWREWWMSLRSLTSNSAWLKKLTHWLRRSDSLPLVIRKSLECFIFCTNFWDRHSGVKPIHLKAEVCLAKAKCPCRLMLTRKEGGGGRKGNQRKGNQSVIYSSSQLWSIFRISKAKSLLKCFWI